MHIMHTSSCAEQRLALKQTACNHVNFYASKLPCIAFSCKSYTMLSVSQQASVIKTAHRSLLDDAKHIQWAQRHEKSISFLSLCVGWSPAVKMISGQLKDACASSTSARGCFYETLIERCFFFALFYLFILFLSGQQKVSVAIERVILS